MSETTRTRSAILRASAIAMAIASVLGAGGTRDGWSQSRSPLELRTLSSRADLVSGGDALVEVGGSAGTALRQVTLTLNGKDVTDQLKQDPTTGRYRGLIDGMALGTNTLVAKSQSPKAEARLTVTNHPITGPILSGPHLTPYECGTEASGLGPALDANCSAPRKLWYVYRTSDNTFKLHATANC